MAELSEQPQARSHPSQQRSNWAPSPRDQAQRPLAFGERHRAPLRRRAGLALDAGAGGSTGAAGPVDHAITPAQARHANKLRTTLPGWRSEAL